MSIYGSNSWGDQCGNSSQSPVNLSQSSAKPCDLLCELTFDNGYISQANVIVSDEGLVLQSQTNLGTCKYAGNSYTCQSLLVTHPSHHTIENVQADGEVVAIFSNPTEGLLCVSSLIRVNPAQTDASHFFNAFVPYADPSVTSTPISLGEQWGLFMMVPPAGAYYVYDGSLVVPPCQPTKWVVFKSMINIGATDFALLVKNVGAGSRPVQAIGDRQVYFNDVEQLVGGPMPHDGKTYMRCKRSGKKQDVKPVTSAGLGDEKSKDDAKKKGKVHEWISKQVEMNGIIEIINSVLLVLAICLGIYFGSKMSSDPRAMYPILVGQDLGAWIASFFVKKV